jgi:putative transposase
VAVTLPPKAGYCALDFPLKRSRLRDDQIIAMLKENEVGAKVDDLCRRHGISGATFHAWRKKFAAWKHRMRSGSANWRSRTLS